MLLSSHLRKYNLNSTGYFLLGCDVLRSGGNLLMYWRKVCNIIAYLQHTFLVTFISLKTLKVFLIRPVSNYVYSVTISTLLFNSLSVFLSFFRFLLLFIYKVKSITQISHIGMLLYTYISQH
jgi:hypothetical protein